MSNLEKQIRPQTSDNVQKWLDYIREVYDVQKYTHQTIEKFMIYGAFKEAIFESEEIKFLTRKLQATANSMPELTPEEEENLREACVRELNSDIYLERIRKGNALKITLIPRQLK